jgi:hypothetical protein
MDYQRNTWKKYVEENMYKNLWCTTYRIKANKLKTSNIMSTIKNGCITIGWETIDEIIRSLFVKNNDAVVGDRLLTVGENAVIRRNKGTMK